jgi:hypothetical protein
VPIGWVSDDGSIAGAGGDAVFCVTGVRVVGIFVAVRVGGRAGLVIRGV